MSRVDRITVMNDVVPIDRCNVTNTSTALTNTTAVSNVTTRAGDPMLIGAFADTGVAAGDRVTGTGIAAGTRVRLVLPDGVLMDQPAQADGSITATFYQIGFIEAGWTQGMCVEGTGIPSTAGTTVIASIASETSLTMGTAATATAKTTVTGRSHLKATVAMKTRGVFCQGAAQVFFRFKTTSDVDSPVSSAGEQSFDDGVTYSAADAGYLDGQDNIVGSLVTGRGRLILPRKSAPAENYLAPTHVRCSITGHATNQIDSVACLASVFWD
jgi:hypothetical protein